MPSVSVQLVRRCRGGRSPHLTWRASCQPSTDGGGGLGCLSDTHVGDVSKHCCTVSHSRLRTC